VASSLTEGVRDSHREKAGTSRIANEESRSGGRSLGGSW